MSGPLDLTPDETARVLQRRERAAKLAGFGPHLDAGIRSAVALLWENGVETYESCEGGLGHAYPVPSVRFGGTAAAGWWAVQVCLDHGLPITSVSRIWTFDSPDAPHGPSWQITLAPKP